MRERDASPSPSPSPSARAHPAWALPFGANVSPEGGVAFRVFSPRATSVAVRLVAGPGAPRTVALEREPDRDGADAPGPPDDGLDGDGWFRARVPDAAAGTDYVYVLDGELCRPDPASRHQPAGVFGPSRVVDPAAFAWTDAGWTGHGLADAVLYELHVGTFTAEGTFDAAIGRIPHLVELGIDAVELMPVAQFPGARNWGYDGVFLFAAQETYGGPEGLRRLVDACHAAGIAVVLDVVYNHLGPEGDVTADFGPYKSRRYTTPWGDAINYDGPDSDAVRRFVIENALHWLHEHHIDGLRLDAVDAIFDAGARPILGELAAAWSEAARRLGRRAWLIGESGLNDPKVCRDADAGGWGLHAQWSDDFHHAVHTVLTGDAHGYFVDYGAAADIRKALIDGFVLDGRRSRWRRRRHGTSGAPLPGHAHVVFIQNHDQVANGSGGVRIAGRVSFEASKLAAALLLTSPNVPMLFMGEEVAARTPFHYFTSHSDADLSESVRAGRLRDFHEFPSSVLASFGTRSGGAASAFADPASEEAFLASKLDLDGRRDDPDDDRPARCLALYRELIALRHRTPCLRNGSKEATRVVASERPRWLALERADAVSPGRACLLANLSEETLAVPHPFPGRGWLLALATADPRFGGPPGEAPPPERLDVRPGATPAVALPPFAAAIYLVDEGP